MKNIKDLLKPENLRSVKGLEWLARLTAATLLPGVNKSRRTGRGQEFSQYRSYQPGDDLRLLDWKMYARSDRLYVREAEVKTNNSIHFIIDGSASMLHEEEGIQKIDFARYVVATLAWLAQSQGDEIGLSVLNEEGIHRLPPSKRSGHFYHFLYQLLQINPKGKFEPAQGGATLKGTRKGGRRLLVFLTDMYEHNDELFRFIEKNKLGNELLLFHLMGNKELDLSFSKTATFQDLETGELLQVNRSEILRTYKRKLDAHFETIKTKMQEWAVDYEVLRLGESISMALSRYLRQKKRP